MKNKPKKKESITFSHTVSGKSIALIIPPNSTHNGKKTRTGLIKISKPKPKKLVAYGWAVIEKQTNKFYDINFGKIPKRTTTDVAYKSYRVVKVKITEI